MCVCDTGSGECESNGQAPPSLSDCQKLTTLFSSGSKPHTRANNLDIKSYAMTSIAPSSFFLEADEFSEAPLGTCEYVVFNLVDREIEFCNDDWVRQLTSILQPVH